nr:hypothetical protein [Tanacetum cinerariifolium]
MKLKEEKTRKSFLKDKKQETEKAEVSEAVATLDITPNVKQLPPKEQDPGSFILPCSIERHGKTQTGNMVIEMAYKTKCTPKGIVKNLLVKIKKFIFPVDFVILDMVEDFRMPIILGRPLLATTHAKESYEEIFYGMTDQRDPWKTKKMDKANMEQRQDLTPTGKPK